MLPSFRRPAGPAFAILTFLSALAAAPAAQDFSTLYAFSPFAGVSSRGNTDGKAADARFADAEAIACDATGNLYVADGNLLRKISPGGTVTTLNVALSAGLYYPRGLAVDSAGNLYVANTSAHTLCKVTPDGTLSIVAGAAGAEGSADGTGAAARFSLPMGIVIGPAGDLFVAEYGNRLIRRVTPAGVVTTVAGQAGSSGTTDGFGTAARFYAPQAITADAAGTLYVADNDAVRRISPAGEVTTLAGVVGDNGTTDGTGAAARFTSLRGIAVDPAGNVFVAEDADTIRKITPGGVVSHFAGAVTTMGGADGTGANATFFSPRGLAADATGNLYVADWQNNTIRKITPAGAVTTVAGISPYNTQGYADGQGSSARFHNPGGVVVDATGNLYVSDPGNHVVRKITPAGVVSTLAGAADAAGTADGTGSAARFGAPAGIALGSAGVLYVADQTNASIRKLTTGGVVSTLATGINGPAGLAVDSAGNVYALDNSDRYGFLWKISPSGGKAFFAGGNGGNVFQDGGDGTGALASFWFPQGVTIDATGTLYVADSGQSTIRRVTPAGVVTTLAGKTFLNGWDDGPNSVARFRYPTGITVDASGNIFICDTENGGIRKIAPAGTVSTLASATVVNDNLDAWKLGRVLQSPSAIAVDAQGNLYVVQDDAILKGQRAAAPAITAQPQGATVAAGGSAQFSVTASGAPVPTYQWFFNGRLFEGATGSTLSFSSANSTDAGDYTVKVTNALGSVTSSTAKLTVSSGSSSGGGSSGGGSGGGDGGGAPSPAFIAGLLVLAGVRRLTGCRRPAAA